MSVNRRVTVTLDADLVRQLDTAAKAASVSRSDYIGALIDVADWSDASSMLRSDVARGTSRAR